MERAQLKLSEKELNSKAKQYDSLIDDVINSQVSPEIKVSASAVTSEAVSTSVQPEAASECWMCVIV